ncbi:MAG TPA: PaaI family thioesterase [Pseudomonadales bacterium]
MKLLLELRERGAGQDMAAVLAAIPYARFLGVEVQRQGNEVITVLPFSDKLVGNPILPAIHGGVIGALLEITAVVQLLYETACERLPKTVDVNFDYLRSGRAVTTYGRAIVNRQGRRVANVRSEIWQESRDKPIALSQGHYLLQPL